VSIAFFYGTIAKKKVMAVVAIAFFLVFEKKKMTALHRHLLL